MARTEPHNPNTDWFRDARHGVFMHVLPGNDRQLELLKDFDVDALAGQLAEGGARYLVMTLGQNSGWFIAPNATYDRQTGYEPGERCSTRDLPLDLFKALEPRGIRLMLYLPCQVPNRDARAQRAFGLREGPQDQPLSDEFAAKWAEVTQEWSDRYGDKVAGWWFDGGYQHIQFNESIARTYARAVKHGNPRAIVTFNPGVRVIHYTGAEDYTAGELNEPLAVIPASRWLEGSQWHALTYLGSGWGRRDTRFSSEQWVDWIQAVIAREGVVSLDMGTNWDPAQGPVGSLAAEQMAQLRDIAAAIQTRPTAANPKRLPRADSYFGLHFDFHAGPDCTEIGKNTTPERVGKIIEAAHPDYIQIDCKGHPGLSSYPTKVGNPAPGFIGDPLRIWRDVTAAHGVALYMHYSGVWDSEAIRQHPDWAVINADGKPNNNATSFFGPYAERLLIPQLRELAGVYRVDGAWVDGECWASQPDYGDAALKAFKEATGIEDVPRRPGEPHWFEFLEFNREAFRKYLRHYIKEVKRTHPEMQLCSNWAFSDHMPEPVCAPVNWISGDFTPQDSVNSARMSARYLVHQGKPWDLMAWSFITHGEHRNGSRQKSAVQIEREAALVLSQGGGFQFYHNQRRDGSVPEEVLPVIREVAEFCRARQPFCQGAVPVPQVAFLYSTASHYREINSLFGRDLSRLAGTLQALIEGRQGVDVVSESHLAGRMSDYPVIVVGECDYLEPAFKQQLVDYVRNGGNLLLVGPQAASMFASELGVNLEGAQGEPRYLAWEGALSPTRDQTRVVRPPAKATAFGELHTAEDGTSTPQPAASINALGRGRIAATWFSFSRGYLANRAPEMRSFLNALVRELFPEPLVEVVGNPSVDVCMNRLNEKLAINLINTSGAHWDQEKPLIDEIRPIGPIQVVIRQATAPNRITLQPDGQPLEFGYRDGMVRVTVPQVRIHEILILE